MLFRSVITLGALMEYGVDFKGYREFKVMQTKQMLAGTFDIPMEFNGGLYSKTPEKQNFLTAQLGLYALNAQLGIPMELTWDNAGGVCEKWELEDLITLANAMQAEIKPLVMAQQEAEVAINGAEDMDEVEYLMTEYAFAIDVDYA